MRTYSRETYIGAKAAWDDGQFGPEWREVRRISWARGFPYPPEGTREDDREVENPSQRAIIWQALDWRPEKTVEIVRTSKSWWQVVERIMAQEEGLREDADIGQKEADYERAERPEGREAVQALGRIFTRISDSVAR